MVWHRCVMYSTRVNGRGLKAGRKRRVDTKPSKGWQERNVQRLVASLVFTQTRGDRGQNRKYPWEIRIGLFAHLMLQILYRACARGISAGGRAGRKGTAQHGPFSHVPADWETKSPFGMTTLSSEFLAQSTMPLRPFMGKLMSVITDTAGSLWMLATASQHTDECNFRKKLGFSPFFKFFLGCKCDPLVVAKELLM